MLQGYPSALPLYREGAQDDVENLKKLAKYVGWADLTFQDNYVLGRTLKVSEDSVRLEGFGVRPLSAELQDITTLELRMTRDYSDVICLIHYVTALVNVYGNTVEGILMQDGWHGPLAEYVRIANEALPAKMEAIRKSPSFKKQPFYPRSMWR